MTKMKSKKMTKSTFAIIIMGIIMVAMLAFGGTFAYFTATANQSGATIVTGKLSMNVTTNVETVIDADLVPNQQVNMTAVSLADAFGDTNTIGALRAKVTIKAATSNTTAQAKDTFDVSGTAPAGWTMETTTVSGNDIVIVLYYGKAFKAGVNAPTELPKIPVTMKSTLDGADYMGKTFDVSIAFDYVQAEYLESSTTVGYEDGAELTLANAQAIFTRVGK